MAAPMSLRVVVQADGGFSVEFLGGNDAAWARIGGFATAEMAHDWIREFMVNMMMALKPLN